MREKVVPAINRQLIEVPEANAPTASAGASRAQQVMDAVTGFMRQERLKVGDRLPSEMYFATKLGVSRAVTREAFQALAALRLIDVGNGRRARVGLLDSSVMAASLHHAIITAQVTVQQVWDVRRTLELRTAVLAALVRSDSEAKAILAFTDAMWRDRADLTLLTEHDIAFHREIAVASHNALFQSIVASFAGLMCEAVPIAWRTRRTEAERTIMLERHRAVADAILAQDPTAAEAAMDGHFDQSVKSLLGAGLL